MTGKKGTGRKSCAQYIEKRLCLEGKKAYYLPFNNVIHGVNADISKFKNEFTTKEHFRRLSEIVNILTDAGLIVLITIQDKNNNQYRKLLSNDIIEITIENKNYEKYYEIVANEID
ncbi:adenylyl-sulfate kinase [Mycoplasmatota bacterium]|nr:adenylyl-sulfate kinase [Mycoplasmatota bacterium]